MYIKDNNLKSIQDIVNHINHISNAEAVIANENCEMIAICSNNDMLHGSFCFDDQKLYDKCNNFLANSIQCGLLDGYYSGLCWVGIRLTLKKIEINNKIFYISIDKFLLDTDDNVFNEKMVEKEIDNKVYLEHIRAIYYAFPILTNHKMEELLDIMELCLKELLI